MKCTRTDNDTESRLQLEGVLDALTTADVAPVFEDVVTDRRRRVIVDLERVTMIDSWGVGAIVSLYKRVTADGGQVVVVGARDQPLSVLKLLKLERVLGL